MTTRRRRQHPVEFGRASTFVETVEADMVKTLSERFLKAINYYGLVEVEFKYDTRDRQFKILDVNARTWGYLTLGRRAGVDFPFLLYADQMGWDLGRRHAPAGIAWLRMITDVPTSLSEILKGRLSPGDYLTSLRSFDTEAVFARDDLRPGFAELALFPYLYFKRGSILSRIRPGGKNGLPASDLAAPENQTRPIPT